jgi:curved DNA-binding protein CbpA
MQQTYFDVLGIPFTASETEIKQAFRKKAKALHPDLNRSPKAKEEFLLIYEAYRNLMNREDHHLYNYKARKEAAENRAKTKSNKTAYRQSKYKHKTEEATSPIYEGSHLKEFNPPLWLKRFFYLMGIMLGSTVIISLINNVMHNGWPYYMLTLGIIGVLLIYYALDGLITNKAIRRAANGFYNSFRRLFVRA